MASSKARPRSIVAPSGSLEVSATPVLTPMYLCGVSRRASRSPASALSETARSSSRRFLVSSEGSSAPGSGSGTSVLSFASAVAGRYQVGPGEDTRRLRELLERGAEGFQALQLRPLPLLALLPHQAEVGVGVGHQLRYLPGPDVPL